MNGRRLKKDTIKFWSVSSRRMEVRFYFEDWWMIQDNSVDLEKILEEDNTKKFVYTNFERPGYFIATNFLNLKCLLAFEQKIY